MCRLSVVSQTQTTSLTRPSRHLRYTRADLGSSSLKKVQVQFADGTMSIAEGERYKDACVRERGQFGGGSIMIWAEISLHTKTPMAPIL